MRVWTNGRDLFAEMCLRKSEVAMLHAFDIRQDGMCAAKRPGNLKKSKKWKPDCAATETPAMHPFKKPDEYAACMEVGNTEKDWRIQHRLCKY